MAHFALSHALRRLRASHVLRGPPKDLREVAVFRKLPPLLPLDVATDDFVRGVQFREAARALIRGRTFAVTRVGIVVHALAAAGEQMLRPNLRVGLERIVPLEGDVTLAVSLVPNLPPRVVADQELPVTVGHRLHCSNQRFHVLEGCWHSGDVAMAGNRVHRWAGGGRNIRCFVVVRCDCLFGATDLAAAKHGASGSSGLRRLRPRPGRRAICRYGGTISERRDDRKRWEEAEEVHFCRLVKL